jgi:hypothetical protein
MLSRCHVDVLPGCFEISGGKAFREEEPHRPQRYSKPCGVGHRIPLERR